MRKFFFYKDTLNNNKKYKKKEFEILVRKLIKTKFSKQIFSMNYIKYLHRKTFCLNTGFKRSVNSWYYLSRMCLKEQYRKCLLNGFRKVS